MYSLLRTLQISLVIVPMGLVIVVPYLAILLNVILLWYWSI